MDDVELGRLLDRQATISEPSVESLRAVVRRDRRTRGRNLAVVVVVALAVVAIAGGLYGEREPAPSIVLPTEDVQLASFESEQLAALGVAGPKLDEAGRRGPGPAPQPAGSNSSSGRRTTASTSGLSEPRRRESVLSREAGVRGVTACAVHTLRAVGGPGVERGCHRSPPPPAVFTKPGGRSVGVLHAGIFGGRERSPAQWVAVLAGPEVAAVRATFADGSLDEIAPVDGYAVAARGIELAELSTSVDSSPMRPRLGGTAEGLDASGTVLTVDEFAPGDTFRRPDGCPAPGSGLGGKAPPPPILGNGRTPARGLAPSNRPGPGNEPARADHPGPSNDPMVSNNRSRLRQMNSEAAVLRSRVPRCRTVHSGSYNVARRT